MAKLIWDRDGERLYETGVCHVVLYPKRRIATPFGTTEDIYGPGVAWNGVTSISVSPSGGEPQPLWADDVKYLNLLSTEELTLTIEAYTYPDEFGTCLGILEPVKGMSVFQQKRTEFALSFETKIGNDLKGTSYGRKLHMVYGCLAAPAERGHQTISDSLEPITMSWTITTSPKTLADGRNTAIFILDSTKTGPRTYSYMHGILQGRDNEIEGFTFSDHGFDAELPYPDDVVRYMAQVQDLETEGRMNERYSVVYDSSDNHILAVREDNTGRYLY